MAKDRLSGKLAVILHADIVGSTALVHQGEQLAHQRMQDAFQRFGDTISKYYGQVREIRGDAPRDASELCHCACLSLMVGKKELLTLSLKQGGYLTRVVGEVAPSHHP